MKSFKAYLTESKKTYDFKIKIVGDLSEASAKIKQALDCYKVESCSSGKRSPIQETHVDFPDHKNTNVTTFDVCVCYPATSLQVQALVSEALNLQASCVKVRNELEEAEVALNHAHDEKSGESLLSKDYESASEGQKLVGEKQKMSLLKDLGKVKKTLEQYTGVNDSLLASKSPAGDSVADKAKVNSKSPVGSSKVKLPTAKTVGAR